MRIAQWKSLAAIGLTAALALAAFGQTPAPDTIADVLLELSLGNIVEAISKLKRIVQENPVPEAYFYLSGIYTEMGRYDAAFRYLERAIIENPTQGSSYHQLGLIRRAEGCRPEAIAAFTQALKMGMGNDEATVWNHIGDAQLDLSQWDKAIDAYRNALRVQPDDADSHLALGRVYLDRNDPEAAMKELRAALETAPALGGLLATLGRAYRASGDFTSAISTLRKSIERDDSDQESRYILAQTLLAAGHTSEGRQVTTEYQNLQDRMTQTDAALETAVGRAQGGDLAGAEKVLKNALKLAQRYAPVHQVLGTVLLNRGSLQPALEEFRQALATSPLNPETYFNMGAVYLRTAKPGEALDVTQKAIVIDDEDARFFLQLGEIYSRMNRQDLSRSALAKAAELKSVPGYRAPDAYASEGRRRDDANTVRRICSGPPEP